MAYHSGYGAHGAWRAWGELGAARPGQLDRERWPWAYLPGATFCPRVILQRVPDFALSDPACLSPGRRGRLPGSGACPLQRTRLEASAAAPVQARPPPESPHPSSCGSERPAIVSTLQNVLAGFQTWF